MRPRTSASLAILFCLWAPAMAGAQAGSPAAANSQQDGGLPDASFEAFFRKYTPPANQFSPFAAWDANLALRATVFRRRSNAVEFVTFFQSVGIETPGSRVGVAGTGYLVRLAYVRTYSDDLTLAAGVAHLSSHLTRDLDQRLDRARREGTPIPIVEDPSEYNVPFVRIVRAFPRARLAPEIDVAIQPVNVRVGSHRLDDVRPVYLGTRWALWRGAAASMAVETQHEFGKNPLNNFALVLELLARRQSESRLHVFVSMSPGSEAHVSPNIGALRNGLAFGLRLRFRAAP